MTESARANLAAQQSSLVRALVADGPIPPGFDGDRVKTLARSLVNKRRQALARAWPRIARLLGNAYVEQFTTYARANPLPASGSPLEDGRHFLHWLDEKAPLPDSARMEAMAFDLRFYSTPLGLRDRGGFGVKIAKMRETPALVIALRLPWLRIRWLRIPLGRARVL